MVRLLSQLDVKQPELKWFCTNVSYKKSEIEVRILMIVDFNCHANFFFNSINSKPFLLRFLTSHVQLSKIWTFRDLPLYLIEETLVKLSNSVADVDDKQPKQMKFWTSLWENFKKGRFESSWTILKESNFFAKSQANVIEKLRPLSFFSIFSMKKLYLS